MLISFSNWEGKIAQQVNVLATKPDNLSLIQDTHGRKRKNNSYKWSSDSCNHTIAYSWTQNKYFKKNLLDANKTLMHGDWGREGGSYQS